MKNVTELRTELASLFKDLRAGTIDHKVAKELNNTAGKMIASVGMQLKAAALSKKEPKIPFLG